MVFAVLRTWILLLILQRIIYVAASVIVLLILFLLLILCLIVLEEFVGVSIFRLFQFFRFCVWLNVSVIYIFVIRFSLKIGF